MAPTPRRPRGRALDRRGLALLAIVAGFGYATLLTLGPFTASLVLAAWAASILRPLYLRLSQALRGSQRAAALLTGALLVLVAAPIALAIDAAIPAATSLLDQLGEASGGRGLLAALVSDGDRSPTTAGDVLRLLRDYGADASRALTSIAGASIEAALGVFVFFVAFFALLVEGERGRVWIERFGPLDPAVLRRMGAAFHQAGHGLLVGNGLTALAQGGLATITYAALGVPRALLLGLLSVVGALLPLTGPAIVWIPVALGLALTGSLVRAAILTVIGVGVVGTVDNLMRPWLARRAHVGLSTSVVLVSMLGGIAAFGGWGLLLGPLAVRLTAEALALARERGLFGRPPPPRPVRPPSPGAARP